jgi:hypothetical protein
VLAILVVGGPGSEETEPSSAVEVLHARDADEAVEKLGRNRRIDAVLVLDADPAAETVAAIREDVVAPPPIFLASTVPSVPGARSLAAARDIAGLLREIVDALGGGSP